MAKVDLEVRGSKGNEEMNNNQINNTDYYRLPKGKYLEDFIYEKGLNFNIGSALKYRWRAGKKDGESKGKDMAKAQHYVEFEARCRLGGWIENLAKEIQRVEEEVQDLLVEAKGGH